MKSIIVASFAVLLTLGGFYNLLQKSSPLPSSDNSEDVLNLFESWKAKHNKFYETDDENAYRFQVFRDNYKFVQQFNSEGNTEIVGLNIFADLTNEEYRTKLTANVGAGTLCNASQYSTPNPVPTSVNWVSKGVMPPVMNMGQCGASWALASVVVADAYYAIEHNDKLTMFSSQQLIDCDRANQGCNGGYPENAFYYIMVNGIETEADYPYTGNQGKCMYNASLAVHVFDECVSVTPNNATALQIATANTPNVVLVDAGSSAFQLYSGGVITKNCGTQVDSVIVTTGFGTINGVEAWTFQNLWGSAWGEEGFVNIAASRGGASGLCGIYTAPIAPSPAP